MAFAGMLMTIMGQNNSVTAIAGNTPYIFYWNGDPFNSNSLMRELDPIILNGGNQAAFTIVYYNQYQSNPSTEAQLQDDLFAGAPLSWRKANMTVGDIMMEITLVTDTPLESIDLWWREEKRAPDIIVKRNGVIVGTAPSGGNSGSLFNQSIAITY